MELTLNQSHFWDSKYISGQDGWDLKSVNPVFASLFRKEALKPEQPLLVLGCGKGYDSHFSAENNLRTVGIDFSLEAISFAKKNNHNKNVFYLQEDIFELRRNHPNEFNSIYEYVTICAVNPARRLEFLENIFSALKEDGKFYTVLFPVDNRTDGPPFAINLFEFIEMSKKYFSLEYFSKIIPSVKPRIGKEVLLIFRKKKHAG